MILGLISLVPTWSTAFGESMPMSGRNSRVSARASVMSSVFSLAFFIRAEVVLRAAARSASFPSTMRVSINSNIRLYTRFEVGTSSSDTTNSSSSFSRACSSSEDLARLVTRSSAHCAVDVVVRGGWSVLAGGTEVEGLVRSWSRERIRTVED